MDFNDINDRLRRIYASVGALSQLDVVGNTQIREVNLDGAQGIVFNFGSMTEAEVHNTVFIVLGLMAGLKDHLINKLGKKVVEDFINASQSMCLVIDLNNSDKHGYPLTKTRRSGRDPKIINLSQALDLDNGPGKPGSYFSFDPDTGESSSHGNAKISVTGEVVDINGNFIISIERLINDTLTDIENFMKNNGF